MDREEGEAHWKERPPGLRDLMELGSQERAQAWFETYLDAQGISGDRRNRQLKLLEHLWSSAKETKAQQERYKEMLEQARKDMGPEELKALLGPLLNRL